MSATLPLLDDGDDSFASNPLLDDTFAFKAPFNATPEPAEPAPVPTDAVDHLAPTLIGHINHSPDLL